jgi:serine/threonine protein kinase
MERALMCPQCNAPLAPQRFAQSVVCSYCGTTVRLDSPSVSATIFHEAFRVWNSPKSYQIASWISIGENHWELDKCIANGDISDVYTGQRARWPTELVIVKLLRDRKDIELFNNEWDTLQMLHRSDAPGADTFTALIPQPVMRGDITTGSYAGQRANIFRWRSGFYHTFEAVKQAYSHGIPPRASIWIWRRILEVLSFIHRAGIVHGAVLPSHLLIQKDEHGVMLVGYGSSGQIGQKFRTISSRPESFYPQPIRSLSRLTTQADLIMSALCMVDILGGNPMDGSLPVTVPKRLAGVIRQIALADPVDSLKTDAWAIREELGVIAGEIFGPPQFIPIVMPS